MNEYYVIDRSGNNQANLKNLKEMPDYFEAVIVHKQFEKNLNELFLQFEQYVKDQSLMLLDNIEEQIDGYSFKLMPNNTPIFDVQITSNNEITFKMDR